MVLLPSAEEGGEVVLGDLESGKTENTWWVGSAVPLGKAEVGKDGGAARGCENRRGRRCGGGGMWFMLLLGKTEGNKGEG